MIDNHRHPFFCSIFYMVPFELPSVIPAAMGWHGAGCCTLLYLRESQHKLKNISENIKNAFHV